MIRILQMIGSLNIGGSQTMIMNIYRKIDRGKIQFDFIIDHPEQLYFSDEVKKMGGNIYFLPEFKGTNFFEVKKAWQDFFNEHNDYVILHSHVRSYASIYIPIAKKYGLKTIIHSHSTSNGEGFTAFVKKILQYPLRYQADCLMACSAEAGEWLFGKKNCQKDKFIFISNGIDVQKYEMNSIVRNEYRKILNIDNQLVFGHVGRFHEAKNHEFLIKIFSRIHKMKNNSVLILVGDGELRNNIKNLIKSLSLEEDVLLFGNRNDVPKLLQAMDVFIFPSKWEGLPMTVVEAQAAGLPCIIADTITNDVNVSELVHQLSLSDENMWIECALSGLSRHDVSDKIKQAGFDVKESTRKLVECYMKLINEE